MKLSKILVGAAVAGAFTLGSVMPAMAHDDDGPVNVHAAGDPASQSGYIVISGNDTTQDGYIGVDSNSDSGLVGCWDGEYDHGSGQNSIAVPPGSPDSNDPCSPPSGP